MCAEYRETCYFCKNPWGGCRCDFPQDDGSGVCHPDGFDWEGMWITQPNVSACTRFFVDPVIYYGQPYIDFRDRKETA